MDHNRIRLQNAIYIIMPFDELFANRIRKVLDEQDVHYTEKKMFSGICFLVDDKMLCGTHQDKMTMENLLLCRLSEEDFLETIELAESKEMNFTGKPMKGFVYITEQGTQSNKALEKWLQLCLNFNPLAKKSKKK